ncbi:hypothetical protein Esi_0124_0044 [Ectocarpus siliculosus]|uniref:Uncharacterized protein n=1 Tax=Ectocarpus siliculosus TaxID=2880 RepID=D7FIY3_ECTSI|nr:hypothetical protein Esi_0124_0044 [Ectocarpus siliculosus]|eukprot:CBJ28931.1 hypothetical protein Esi_0124_0044 [Ectocarpus siliculosus]
MGLSRGANLSRAEKGEHGLARGGRVRPPAIVMPFMGGGCFRSCIGPCIGSCLGSRLGY